jgi:hypothetical protein
MSGFTRLQLVGPALLFAALLGADAAAYALATYPSSALLWRINLGVFGIFQKADYVLSAFVPVAYFQLAFIGAPLAALALAGVALRRRLLLALASNLSFAYSAFLLCAWYACEQAWHQGSGQVASLMLVLPSSADFGLLGPLLGATLLSLVVSHMGYLRLPGGRHACSDLCVAGASGRRRGVARASRLD